jgi:hypothetical protein
VHRNNHSADSKAEAEVAVKVFLDSEHDIQSVLFLSIHEVSRISAKWPDLFLNSASGMHSSLRETFASMASCAKLQLQNGLRAER